MSTVDKKPTCCWLRPCSSKSTRRAASPTAVPRRRFGRSKASWRSEDVSSTDETCSGTSVLSSIGSTPTLAAEWVESGNSQEFGEVEHKSIGCEALAYVPDVPAVASTGSSTRIASSDDLEGTIMEPGLQQVMQMFLPGGPFASLGGSSDDCERRALATRLLRKHGGDLSLVIPRMEHALKWRAHHDNLFRERDFQLASDYRVIGADLEKRPLLYTCMRNQVLPFCQFRDQQVVTMFNAIDNISGGAGASIHICDLHGMRLRLADMNPSPLVEWARSQENYFAGMMHQVIIVDMPRTAGMLKEAIWPLVPAGVKWKIKFFNLDETQQHLESICDDEVAKHVVSVMQKNRDASLSLEDRQPGWHRMDQSGVMVPLVAQS